MERRRPHAELLSIGSELTVGETPGPTPASWLVLGTWVGVRVTGSLPFLTISQPSR